MDRELGAKFEFNGTTLKVVKGKLCYGCYFFIIVVEVINLLV